MRISSLPTTPSLVAARPPEAGAPAEKPRDKFERTAFGEAIDSLPKYARGAALGLGTVTPPLLGGMALGLGGAVLGGVASFGVQYALDKNPGRAAEAAVYPTLLGALASASQAAPTALRVAGAVGIGLVAGLASVVQQDLEKQISEKESGPVRNINKPGQKVDIPEHLVPGKTNVVVFSADWCPACQHLEPGLEKFVNGSGEHVLLKVDIKDWKSPVSEQFGLKSIPHILIYNGAGEQIAAGDAARDQVDSWTAAS